jgi:aspartate aminotransferase-like enzyme
VLAGFSGSPERAEWLDPHVLEPLLSADVEANIGSDQAQVHIRRVVDRFEELRPRLDQIAEERGNAVLDAHRRVRKATRSGVRALKVEVYKPADVLGVYVYLPIASPGGAT